MPIKPGISPTKDAYSELLPEILPPEWRISAGVEKANFTYNLEGIVMLTSLKWAEATIEMLCPSRNALSACLPLPDVEGLTTNCAIRLCGR